MKLVLLETKDLYYHPHTRMLKVMDYMDAMLKGDEFPPINVYRKFFGERWIVTDGAHRSEACRRLGRQIVAQTSTKIEFVEKDILL